MNLHFSDAISPVHHVPVHRVEHDAISPVHIPFAIKLEINCLPFHGWGVDELGQNPLMEFGVWVVELGSQ